MNKKGLSLGLAMALGALGIGAALWMPWQNRVSWEWASGNPVQRIGVQARSLLGVAVSPWRVRLVGCPSWGVRAGEHFLAPRHAQTLHVSAWPGFKGTVEVSPSDGGVAQPVLQDVGEREAFRRWFVAIVEQQVEKLSPAWETAQQDCAGLLRFAYREAWAPHDEVWRQQTGFTQGYAGRSPRSNAFSGLFLTDGGWQPFARGAQLRRHNCTCVGRDVALGQPGDLLFFCRPGASSTPDHAMALVRPDGNGAPVLVYHTGPENGPVRGDRKPGEMRRVRLEDLMCHPDPDFRPHADNPAFLGVYRWNVLAEEAL